MILILSLLLISCLSPILLQESSISFSPTSSVCTGDTVSITCYGYPTEGMELEPFAQIILTTNVNLGITLTFTVNSSIPGYSVTGDIPVRGNSARLQLTILSYQLTDSDSSLACVVTHAVSGSSYTAASSRTPALSVRPSSPIVTSVAATPQSAVTCSNFVLSWLPADSGSTIIDRYYIFRGVIGVSAPRREFVATTADTQLFIQDPLEIATRYFYHVIASNCAGNSTQSDAGIISLLVFIDGLSLSYDSTEGIITLDWNMDDDAFPRYFRYSLNLTYRLTDGNATQEMYTFSRISTDNTFLTQLANDVTAGTNLSACIQIIEQCEQQLIGWDAKECTSLVTVSLPTNSGGLETVPIPTLVSFTLLALVSLSCLFSLVVVCLLIKCNLSLKSQLKSKEREIPDRFII